MNTINFGIVGCGFIAAKQMKAIKSLPDCRLAAVFDLDQKAAAELARDTTAVVYDSYEELLNDPEVNVVNICTPGDTHAVLGIQAAAKGKHVLVEKPLAVHLADADALIDACDRYGVVLAAVHQNRFKAPVQALKQAMDSGYLGKISHGSAVLRWNRNSSYYSSKPWRGDASKGGGVLLNQAIHNIDLLQWMLGPVERVYGHTSHVAMPIKAEETALAVLKFASGVHGVVEASSVVYPQNMEETLAIFGSEGTVVLSGKQISCVDSWSFKKEIPKPSDFKADPEDPGGYKPLLKNLAASIRGRGKPLVDGREGRKALEIITAIRHSNQTGKPVDLPL